MRQLVYTMFIPIITICFLWWKENLVKHQRVSKYYDQDRRFTLFESRMSWFLMEETICISPIIVVTDTTGHILFFKVSRNSFQFIDQLSWRGRIPQIPQIEMSIILYLVWNVLAISMILYVFFMKIISIIHYQSNMK